ncbi:SDR family oxidoreductase [Streptomyces sp. NPDC004232]|uniref:SDR family oxidoreductase n=1 Tax=Streptomyces sp. NPDC004232 TaxID=3154454 RepID=UPI001D5C4508|nr:SDR family oxidoreductase [Streptomyces sp. tea 10]
MIAVTGATGTVGGLVARLLADDGPVRLLARDPARAAELGIPGEAVAADFDDPASLVAALAGAHALFVVTANPLRPEHDPNLLTAARESGVRHVVKLSALAVADERADDLITRWQRRNEDLVRACGLPWTILRPRSFMSNSLAWASSIRTRGVVQAADGTSRNACVAPEDIAAVAALALTGGAGEGMTYPLTGPEALSAAEQTAVLAEVLGRPVRFVGTTPEQAYEAWSRRYPEPVAQALLHSARRQRDGAKELVDPTVEKLLGRPALTYRDWAHQHRHDFL